MISWYHMDSTWCIETYVQYTTHHISRDSKVLAQFFCLYSCLMLMFHCSDLWASNPGRSRFLLILDDHSGAVHASPEVRSLLIHSCRKVKQFGNLAKKPVLPDLNKNVIAEKSHWNDLRALIGNYSCRDMHDPMNPLVLGVICLRPQLGSMLRWPLVCLTWKHSTAVILGFPCVRHKLQRDNLATNWQTNATYLKRKSRELDISQHIQLRWGIWVTWQNYITAASGHEVNVSVPTGILQLTSPWKRCM